MDIVGGWISLLYFNMSIFAYQNAVSRKMYAQIEHKRNMFAF